MSTLTTKLSFDFLSTLVSALDKQTARIPGRLSATYALASGTGADQADMIWMDTRTIAASGNEDLDLAGVLTGALGNTLTFATMKALIVAAADGNTNNVVITRPAANGVPLFSAASDAISVKPGGLFVWFAPGTGVTVTAGTGDLINMSNSGGGTGVTYDVAILGCSA